jgi:Family of unknown function (DUF5947)
LTSGALERVIRKAATRQPRPQQERCELCGEPLAPSHRHVLDTRSRELLLCACYACSVLFNRDEASEGHYRLVPDRRIRLDGLSPAALGVPVGLAFFVKQSDGPVVAHYPSPAGATRWETDPAAWEATAAQHPVLAGLLPDVEAVLVNTARGKQDAWLVPIDVCYRLVAIVRQTWRGLSGGDQVWPAIERFFEELSSTSGSS